MPSGRAELLRRHGGLNRSQAEAVLAVIAAPERVVAIDGVAGAGKTTTLAVIREGAESAGYRVEGFAPTSRAAQKLGEAGTRTTTLQMHLARGEQPPEAGERRLYVLDESSLASTRQMHALLTRLHPSDRVLLVGDRRQHEAVEAGSPFAQLQTAGMRTVALDGIVRQKDLELRGVVEQLARGKVASAVEALETQGRVHEIQGRGERIAAIAQAYADAPEGTLVVSPDNRSRAEINAHVHAELQSRGAVGREELAVQTLLPRQDLTGAARTWAERYAVNDVVRYSRGSKETGIGKGAYARVVEIDAARNQLTVALVGDPVDDGEKTRIVRYDPRRQQGVSVYREEPRAFSSGDRVQFTAPAQELGVANRELATVESMGTGRLRLRLDDGRRVEIDPVQHPHLDHGYAVTSHASQGQTAARVLIHVDTELAAKDLLNQRMAYVAVSRGAHDAQIFTDNRERLPHALGREVARESAHLPEQAMRVEREVIRDLPVRERSVGLALGL